MSGTIDTGAQLSSRIRNLPSNFIEQTHQTYENARRVWNGMVDRRPFLIARCSSVEEVRAAVRWARTEGLHVSVRGGGHSVAGNAVCEGGLMIDLSPMKQITIDAQAQIATAAPGVLWGCRRIAL